MHLSSPSLSLSLSLFLTQSLSFKLVLFFNFLLNIMYSWLQCMGPLICHMRFVHD